MRYLLLVYEDEGRRGALPAAEQAAFELACRESDAALRASGYLEGAEEPCGPAATLRFEGGELAVSDLGVAAGAELRAVLTISARDLNEALQVAAAMPQAQAGAIEVRPLRERPADRQRGA